MDERIKRVCAMYRRLNPEMIVGPDTTINNARIQDICAVDGAAYRRVVEWLEKKTSTPPTDVELFKKEMDACFELMKGRNGKYGNSWKKLRNDGIVDLMTMKLDRCQKQKLDDHALEVEIEDVINYGIFLLVNLRNKKS